jgi:hypothetical protein
MCQPAEGAGAGSSALPLLAFAAGAEAVPSAAGLRCCCSIVRGSRLCRDSGNSGLDLPEGAGAGSSALPLLSLPAGAVPAAAIGAMLLL